MSRTKHFQKRASQRGIQMEIVDLALQFGEPAGDRLVLGRRSLEALVRFTREIERKALRALDKGGVIVVEDGDTLITTYRAGSYDRRKARHRHRGQAS